MLTIRSERQDDAKRIHEVITRSFAASELGHTGEADLVDRLRLSCPGAISFVAERGNELVGQILFTPVVINSGGRELTGMGLAPMSVLPDLQRQGIGSRLVNAGVDAVRKERYPFVVVLGHPDYYPRFGFVRATRHRITHEFAGIPDEMFMILLLSSDTLAEISGGAARYRPEFSEIADDA